MKLGIDRLAYYATNMGLGHKTGIDLAFRRIRPDAFARNGSSASFIASGMPGETISVSTGQGAVTTTPLQLARTIGGIAMGGVFKQPHLLKDAQNVGEERFHISEPTVRKNHRRHVRRGQRTGGTGGSLKLAGIEFSGKSGTAQVIGYATRERMGKQKKFEDNAWFVGYAPRRNPEIVVAVLVQESGQHGGEASGPVVRDIIKAYYDKKNKNTQGQLTVEYKRYEFGDGTAPADAAALVNAAQLLAAGAAACRRVSGTAATVAPRRLSRSKRSAARILQSKWKGS